MALFASLLFLAFGLVARIAVAGKESQYPPGDVRNCPNGQATDSSKPLHLMDVLPGFGFDNLRNLDLGQVYNFSFSKCHVSADGLFLLPDDVYLIPVQSSDVDVFSEVFENFNEHTSETSDSINVDASYVAISGKFSYEFQQFKMHMVDTESIAARAQARHKIYTVKIQPDAALNPHFVSRIMDLVAYIQSNNKKVAHYLTDELVRDYGTHVINSIDAGAAISQTTMVKKTVIKDRVMTTKDISVSASASFMVTVKASYEHKTTDQVMNNFTHNTQYSHIKTHGGPPYQLGNFTIQDWENGVLDHLTAIDRSGLPLHTAITSTNMPELEDSTRQTVVDYIYKAVKKYYDINTNKGCLDPDATNFNYFANVDDKSCKHDPPPMNFTFGGMYQTCTVTDGSRQDLCDSLRQKNPLSGGYSCQAPYVAIPLHSGTQSHQQCEEHCHHFLGIKHGCHQDCHYIISTYSAYWCAHDPSTPVARDSGYMFGGVYTTTLPNPITKAPTCPMYFQTLHIGEDMHVCVSNDEQGLEYNMPFGGFYSCTNGNGLASSPTQFAGQTYPQTCPKMFDQVLASVDEDCQINYCITLRAALDYRPRPPTLPPYRHKPMKSNNITDTLLVVYGSNGRIFVKNNNGVWTEYLDEDAYSYKNMLSWLDLEPATTKQHMITSHVIHSSSSVVVVGTTTIPKASPTSVNSSDNTETNVTPIVLGSVFGTLFVCSMVVLAVFGIRYLLGRKKSGYSRI